MASTAAQYTAIKATIVKVVADQAALAADTATETTAQQTFASGLTGVVVFVNSDGTADIITPSTAAPGYTVTTASVLA